MKKDEYEDFQNTVAALKTENKPFEGFVELTLMLKARILDANPDIQPAKEYVVKTTDGKIDTKFYEEYGIDAISDKNVVQYFLNENKTTDHK